MVQAASLGPYLDLIYNKNPVNLFQLKSTLHCEEPNECTVKAQKVIDSENDEVLLYCHSTKREKKEQVIWDAAGFYTRPGLWWHIK